MAAPVVLEVLNHADIVMGTWPVIREFGRFTRAVPPGIFTQRPIFPEGSQVVPLTVPLCPAPEESEATVPLVSSNFHHAMAGVATLTGSKNSPLATVI